MTTARALLLVALLGACSASEARSPTKPILSGASDACAACAADACTAQVAACEANTSCRALHACLGPCADDACRVACRDAHPTAFSALSASVDSCLASRCEAVCGLVCGGYVSSPVSCATCTERSCCEPSARCMKNPACAAWLACEQGCAPTDATCTGGCDRAFPEALVDAHAFTSCVTTKCTPPSPGAPIACVGARFQCLLAPEPPPTGVEPKSAEIFFHVRVYGGTNPALVGAKVTACSIGEADCAASDEATTDSDGLVHVHLRNGTFNGFFRVTHETLMPTRVFFPPSRTDVFHATIFLLTQEYAESLASQAAGGLLPGHGHVLVDGRDCVGNPAPGLSFTLDPPSGVRAYTDSGGKLAPAATKTDVFGVGGYVNVNLVPNPTVHTTVAGFGIEYPTSTVSLKDGWLTYVRVTPTGRP